MSLDEEAIDGVPDSSGELQLSVQPHLPPGPVQLTIRIAAPAGQMRRLADVVRVSVSDQRARGFPGQMAEEICAEEETRMSEDTDRDRNLDAARRRATPGSSRLLYYLGIPSSLFAQLKATLPTSFEQSIISPGSNKLVIGSSLAIGLALNVWRRYGVRATLGDCPTFSGFFMRHTFARSP